MLSRAKFSHLVRAEIPYLKNYQAFIGGKWKAAANNTTFSVYNPATGEKLADVSNSGKADTVEAVFEASKAFQTWKRKTAMVCIYNLVFVHITDHFLVGVRA